ncbi:MAG: hypothetical protein IH598_08565 [Bacteroidales bacterium]|nr:hypothetical protein [Bacteroidales bacterium]
MKRVISLLVITLVMIAAKGSKAQEVVNSIGVRFGHGGISYKYIEDYYRGFETILAFRDNGIQFIGLIQAYKPIKTDRISNLYLYYGAGGHAGYKGIERTYARQGVNGCEIYTDTRFNPVLGADGIVGAEYHFYSIPLAMSLDYKPFIEFFSENMVRVDLWDFGFTLRYTF